MSAVYFAGFDYSSAEAAFAVLDAEQRVLFDRTLPLGGRDSSRLTGWMVETLQEFGLTFADISSWSAGGGPGSFTGLRLASAIVLGLTFRKDAVRRCVSTAAGLAASLPDAEQQDRVLVLYDGRKNELLGFGLEKVNGFYRETENRPVIRSAEDLAAQKTAYSSLIAPQHDMAAVRLVGGIEADSVRPVEHLLAASLVKWNPQDFSRPLTDLTYLRPAVFVAPSEIRKF